MGLQCSHVAPMKARGRPTALRATWKPQGEGAKDRSRTKRASRGNGQDASMKTILIIGIGAGDPRHLTLEAVEALGRTDVVFLFDKGEEKAKLADARRAICARHIPHAHRIVDAASPEWDRRSVDYAATIAGLNADKRALHARLIDEAMDEGETAAILVWGDPALYDSTIRIVSDIAAGAAGTIAFEVIPGISAVQALTARHKVPLNRIGGTVLITTGRRLAAEGLPVDADVVVMLDAHARFADLCGGDIEIFWGAYIGTEDEILIAGPLDEVAGEILAARAEARQRHGWIMDTYLLRRVPEREG